MHKTQRGVKYNRIQRQFNNPRKVDFLDPQIAKLRKEKWMYIRTGDIIKIQQDRQVTADVILLNTSDNHNLAYIETAELDGETNLKEKILHQEKVYILNLNVSKAHNISNHIY